MEPTAAAYTALDGPESIPVEAWNRWDPDTPASIFEEDAEFGSGVGLGWHDREAIRRAHAYGLERIFNRSTLRLGSDELYDTTSS